MHYSKDIDAAAEAGGEWQIIIFESIDEREEEGKGMWAYCKEDLLDFQREDRRHAARRIDRSPMQPVGATIKTNHTPPPDQQ